MATVVRFDEWLAQGVIADAATIFALSSGAPPAALGIIRVSGSGARAAAIALAGAVPEARRASLRWIHDGRGARLDHALLLWFPGPATATGEDVLELHVHGGRAVIAAAQAALRELPGMRPALPGEFTRRAFENGRIDLAEAEGLADLLSAETESQRRSALTMAGGALSRRVRELEEAILRASAQIEAMLDFGDEDDVTIDELPVRRSIASIAKQIDDLLASPTVERLRDGVRVVIAGPPNAGKSTLLNVLTGRDAAIVTPIAGTTRDVIEVPVAIGGVPFVFIDTAGVRDAEDAVERIGIARAREAMASADIILWLDDKPPRAAAHTIIIRSRSDLNDASASFAADLAVSAKTGENIPALIDRMVTFARTMLPAEGAVALNARQRLAMSDAQHGLTLSVSDDLVIVAEGLRVARAALDRLTGRAGTENMLDGLFGRFCIGK